jgi:hypothetical protein
LSCASALDPLEDPFKDQGCQTVKLEKDIGVLELGPGQLRDQAFAMLSRLADSAKRKGNLELGQRLKISAKNGRRKANKIIPRCQAALQQLPAVVLVCPETPVCKQVDNTKVIKDYTRAIAALKNHILHVFNRASRAGEKTIIRTKKFSIPTRRAAGLLIKLAKALPQVISRCVRP